MKKRFLLILIFSIFFLSNSFGASKTEQYKKFYESAKKYESKQDYVYALNYYWNAMELSFPEKSEAIEAFGKLAEKIKSGNPLNIDINSEDADPFLMNAFWKKQINSFNKYYAKNSPYIYTFSEPELLKLDYKQKTSEWKLSYEVSITPKYEVICDIFKTGYDAARRYDWSNINTNWNIPQNSFSEVTLKDSSGNIIGKGISQNQTYTFSDINRENTALIKKQKYELSVIPENPDYSFIIRIPGKKYSEKRDYYAIWNSFFNECFYDSVEYTYPFYFTEKPVPKELLTHYLTPYYKKIKKGIPYEYSPKDIMIFCNLLSEDFGYSPCYSIDGITNVYEWPLEKITTAFIKCDYEAQGYRQPKEEELQHPDFVKARKYGTIIARNGEPDLIEKFKEEEKRILAKKEAEAEALRIAKQIEYEKEQEIKKAKEKEAAENRKKQEELEAQKRKIEEERHRIEEEQANKKKAVYDYLGASCRLGIWENYFYNNKNAKQGLSTTVSVPLFLPFVFGSAEMGLGGEKNIDSVLIPMAINGGLYIPVTQKIKPYIAYGKMGFFYQNKLPIYLTKYSFGCDFIVLGKSLLFAVTPEIGFLHSADGGKELLFSLGAGMTIMPRF